MEENPTFVPVVAALIRDHRGRVLLQQALPGKRHTGQWEFPGGKVDAGETPRTALVREIAEELGIALALEALQPAVFADDAGATGDPALVLFLYSCSAWSGTPAALEGQAWDWFTLEQAHGLTLAPLDRVLLDCLTRGPRP
jgi:8-oxo-dGTP diphosphatase